jgi:hypothetical protein
MKFTPFTKKIEVDAGYKAFYKNEIEKVEVFVIDNGIKVIITKVNYSVSDLPVMKRYFKPYLNLMSALNYAKSLGEMNEDEYRNEGFVLVNDPSIA